jgi:carboxyl-terminal processing protease
MRHKKILALIALMMLVGAYINVYLLSPHEAWRRVAEPQLAEARPSATGAEPQGAQGSEAYDLQALMTLNRAILHIEDSYVEPERVNRRKMIGAALREVQRVVPEVMVYVREDAEKVPVEIEVQVNEVRKTFSVEALKNHYHLIFAFKDIFRFIEKNLKHFDELRDIEYAAINGMLSTLDPHSVLLPPEAYAEMKMSTQGHFGGLGIVIGVRDNQLTVINPIEDTPASRAGIQANDKIVQIMLDSTVNMSLSDAVDMMRGKPGTDIDIYVMREGWSAPKKFTLTRAEIKVKSVKFLSLSDQIGLVRVRNFQSTTVAELKRAIEEMGGLKGKRRLKGLILDLRGNPGGLLDQAAKMSDLFISEGTLVKTVGFGDKVREPKMASARGTIKDLPVAVLVDGSSASASEIVSGALKNHERALIIGRKTFGKGSVQLLFNNPDKSALKLTIAQYLTPGDISIQSVGVTPTVELSPILITDEETYVYGSPDEKHGEATLPEHLISDKSERSKIQKPLLTMKYLQDPELLKKMRDEPNELIIDYEISFAQELLKQSRDARVASLLKSAERLIARSSQEQERELDKRLREREVQWLSKVSDQPATGLAQVRLSPEGPVKAGQDLKVTIEVENKGASPLHKLRAISSSESPLFKGHEFLFGHIPPGERRSWTQTIKVDPSFRSRRDEVLIKFSADGRGEVPSLSFPIEIQGSERPLFALRYELDDSEGGNGDGLLSPGEELKMRLSFENRGPGESLELIGQLSNEGKGVAPALFIKQGRVQPEKQQLKLGEGGALSFVFKVKEGWSEPSTKVYMNLVDTKLRESSGEFLTLPIFKSPPYAQSAERRA